MDLDEIELRKAKGWQYKEIAASMGIRAYEVVNLLKKGKPVVEIDGKELKLLEDSLVGDGSIVPVGLDKAFFTITTANKIYCDWWKNRLSILGFKLCNARPFLLTKEHSGYSKDCWHFFARTTACSGLRSLRTRWYPEGLKRFPMDHEWTIDSLRILIAEDGEEQPKGSLVCWGVKCKDSFQTLLRFLEGRFEYSLWNEHKTSGLRVYIRDTKQLEPPETMTHPLRVSDHGGEIG